MIEEASTLHSDRCAVICMYVVTQCAQSPHAPTPTCTIHSCTPTHSVYTLERGGGGGGDIYSHGVGSIWLSERNPLRFATRPANLLVVGLTVRGSSGLGRAHLVGGLPRLRVPRQNSEFGVVVRVGDAVGRVVRLRLHRQYRALLHLPVRDARRICKQQEKEACDVEKQRWARVDEDHTTV